MNEEGIDEHEEDINYNTYQKKSPRGQKRPCSPSPPPPPGPVDDIGPVIKSPMDSRHYKAIQLKNGLKALLVSTCMHEMDRGVKCVNPGSYERLNESVKEFNKKYLGIGCDPTPPPPPNSSNSSSSSKLQNNNDNKSDWPAWLTSLGNNFFNMQITPLAVASPAASQPRPLEKFDMPIWMTNLGSNFFSSSVTALAAAPPAASQPRPPGKSPKLIRCCYGPSAMCISIAAGSFHDPTEVPGMAHLVEHAVFLGSKKFPEPGHLMLKVWDSEGTSRMVNASTFSENTQYYLSCNPLVLEECIEVLVDGIVSPLLKEDVIRREIEAVDSEYGIKQTDDFTRLDDFVRSLAKKGHPLKTFYWGNKESLSHKNLLPLMKQWRERFYKSNYMTVCIQAPYPIGMIEQMVIKQFAHIPPAPSNWPSPRKEVLLKGDPFEAEAFRSLYYLVPVSKLATLQITWLLPPCFWQDYESKPLHYVRKLINSTYPGGLMDYMKKNHWITLVEEMEATCSCSDFVCRNSFGSVFTIGVILTNKGYQEMEQVVDAIFSYIKLLQRVGMTPEICEEMKKTLANSFHFQNWEAMLESARLSALALHHAKPAHVLMQPQLISCFNPKAIQNCLNHLNPRTACFLYVANGNKSQCKDKTLPCGILYKKVKISEARYKKLETIEPYKDFHMPPPGAFLSKNVILPNGPICAKPPNGVVHQDNKVIISHVNDKRSPCVSEKIPSASISVQFSSPATSSHLMIKPATLQLWNMITQDNVLTKLGYHFDDGLFYNEISTFDSGIHIVVAGPSCSIIELLQIILTEAFMSEKRLDPQFYDDLKQGMIRGLQNDLHDVQTLSKDSEGFLLFNNYRSMFQTKNDIEHVPYHEFLQLIQRFTSCMEVSVYIQGTICKRAVSELATVFNRISYKPAPFIPMIPDRSTILPQGTTFLALKGLHPAYVTSVVTNHYQFGQLDYESEQLFKTLCIFMRRRMANQLRTVEQLGYTVYITPVMKMGTTGLSITVINQPKNFDCAYVDGRIDNFLKLFYNKYLGPKIDPKKNIFSSRLSPDNPKKELAQLRKLYSDHLHPSGSSYRKLSIQLTGFLPKDKDKLTPDEGDDSSDRVIQLQYCIPAGQEVKRKGVWVIDDIHNFKENLGLYPVGFSDEND